MSLNLADPRSIGKYSGIFVSTAPAVDPEICADNYIYFRFKLQALCRSEYWELYLYGDMSIKVDRVCLATFISSMGVPAFERGMGMSMPMAVSSLEWGSSAGRACPTAPALGTCRVTLL